MLQRFFAGEEGGGLFEVVDAGDRQDDVLPAGKGQDEDAVFGEAHGGDGAVWPVAAAGGETVFFQPPFGVAEAGGEDERGEQGEGGEVGGIFVVGRFVVKPGDDDDGEEDGIGSAAAQAHGGEGFPAPARLDEDVVGEVGEVAEVQEAEADGGEHGVFFGGSGYTANLQFKCNSYKKDIHKRYCKKQQNIAGDRKWMPTVILRQLNEVA